MSKSLRFVGLDVHKDSIVIAVAEEGREPAGRACPTFSWPNKNGIPTERRASPTAKRCFRKTRTVGATQYRPISANIVLGRHA